MNALLLLLILVPLLILAGGILLWRRMGIHFSAPETQIGGFRRWGFRRWRPNQLLEEDVEEWVEWIGEVAYANGKMGVHLKDCNGKPNPAFVDDLHQIGEKLADWELEARTRFPLVTGNHALSAVRYISDAFGPALGLCFDEIEAVPETVVVVIRGGLIDIAYIAD